MIIIRFTIRLALIFFYFLVIAPLGWVVRFLGRDRLLLRPRNDRISYWNDVSDH
jgi:hypothetical protein